jgi:hypothetical protein
MLRASARRAGGASYTLDATIEQMAAGASASANDGEYSGFECAFDWLLTILRGVAR